MENKNVKILDSNIEQQYIDYMFNNVISVVFSDIISSDTYNIELKKKDNCIIDYIIREMKKENIYDIDYSIYKYDANIFNKDALLSKYFNFDEKYYDVFYFFILKKEKMCELNYFFLIICKKDISHKDNIENIRVLNEKNVQCENTINELKQTINEKNDLIHKLIDEIKEKNCAIENAIGELKSKHSTMTSTLDDISLSLKYVL